MINLYIINESSLGAVYGIGTYIRELTSALKNSNMNVCVVQLRSIAPDIVLEESEDTRYLHIPSPVSRNKKLDRNRQNELYYRNVVYLLQLQIKETDHLVFQLNYNQNGILAEYLKKTFNCKIVAAAHYSDWGLIIYDNIQRLRSILSKEQPDSFEQNVKNVFEAENLLYSKADRVICLSNYMNEILCSEYRLDPTKITTIPNGLTDTVKTIADKNNLRKKWKITPREKIILFVGRMDEVKGLVYLIRCFRSVLDKYPSCRLIIAGNGNYDSYIQYAKNINTKISFTGLLEKNELYELYQIANVGVVPSLFEQFGYVALEMMMHGLPVVATATSGLNEVVDETCGLKIPIIGHPEKVEIDSTLLAQNILYLLQHPIEARKMGGNGRKRFLEWFELSVFRKNMLNLYHNL